METVQPLAVRIEKDLLGNREVPMDQYYGIHTLRALDNFKISKHTVGEQSHFIRALAQVKKASAQANRKLSTKQLEELVSAQQQILQSDNKKAYPALGSEENVSVAGLGFLAVLLSFFGLGEVKKKRA